jgi:hypothetical protein
MEREKIQLKIFLSYFDQKLQFTYAYASIKDVQATGKAFSPQKRTSALHKIKFNNCFLLFWVIFARLDPDPGTLLNPAAKSLYR